MHRVHVLGRRVIRSLATIITTEPVHRTCPILSHLSREIQNTEGSLRQTPRGPRRDSVLSPSTQLS